MALPSQVELIAVRCWPSARFELARVLLAGDRARALEQARAALAGYRGLGLPAEVAKVERWLRERG